MRRRHGKGTRTACPLKTAHRNRYATSTLTPSSAAKTHLRPEAEAAVRLRPLGVALSFDVDKIRKPLSCEAENTPKPQPAKTPAAPGRPARRRPAAGLRGTACRPAAAGGFSGAPAQHSRVWARRPHRPDGSSCRRWSAPRRGSLGVVRSNPEFKYRSLPLICSAAASWEQGLHRKVAWPPNSCIRPFYHPLPQTPYAAKRRRALFVKRQP